MNRKFAILAVIAAFIVAAPAAQTKWIYKPSTSSNVGTLVDDSDSTRVLSDVRLISAGSTSINIYNNKNTQNLGHLDLSLPIESEDGTTTYTINLLGNNAFEGNSTITRLTLPPSLTEIQQQCFNKCAKLSQIDFAPAGQLKTLASQCFGNCSALSCDIVVPDSVTTFTQPFRYSAITSITFGSGITEIPNDCFYGSSALKFADWSAATSLRRIGSQAFRECKALQTISPFPDSLVDLGSTVFYNCTSLTGDIVIPDSVTSPISGTFRYTQISSIKIGSGVPEISQDSFRSLTTLTSLDLSSASSLKKIGDYCFQDDKNMVFDFATLPRSLESIGGNAFWQCQKAFGDVVLPPAVTSITGAFRYSGITSFTASPALLTISNDAFCNCSSMTKLDLSPATSLESIGSSAFKDLKSMVCDLSGDGLPRSLKSIGSQAFWYDAQVTGEVVLPDAVETVENVFRGTGITSFTAGAGLKTIGGQSFAGMKTLLHLDLTPATGLTTISNEAFKDCSGITNALSIPKSVTTIGTQAFWYCTKMTGTVILPDEMTDLGNQFRGCPLDALIAGSGLTNIANEAMRGTPLRAIDLSPAKNLKSIGERAFQDCSSITNDLVFPKKGLETIKQLAFYSCNQMGGDIVLPETVTELPTQTFGYSKIRSFTATGLKSIGDQVFRGCSALTRIELGWDIDTILGHECLNGASNAKAIYWRGAPDPTKCTGDPPMGGFDWRVNGATNYIPWDVKTKAPVKVWQDFADAYNADYGTLLDENGEPGLPTKRDAVGTMKHNGRNEREYVAYWIPDLLPATVIVIR